MLSKFDEQISLRYVVSSCTRPAEINTSVIPQRKSWDCSVCFWRSMDVLMTLVVCTFVILRLVVKAKTTQTLGR
jgi:hypothetical protein